MRFVSVEVRAWRRAADQIPDPELRRDALNALERKRANIDGAALFWTIPNVRSRSLLRLLVAYEILADFLDCTSERSAHIGIHNGLQLHSALLEAVKPGNPVSDYYRYHPWKDDGGYAVALVKRCQALSGALPSFGVVRTSLHHAARLTEVLAHNHEPDPAVRDKALRAWAARQRDHLGTSLAWFEATGAASAWLTVLALLALAADPNVTASDAHAVSEAYLPWVSLAGTMLDSYSDRSEDRRNGDHSYIAHYPSFPMAISRVGEITARAMYESGRLPNGARHRVLVSCMVAMYLTKDSSRTELSETTSQLARHGGEMTRALAPILRAWRIVYGQQSDGAQNAPDRKRTRKRTHGLPRGAPAPAVAQTLAFWRNPHAYLAWCRKRYGPTFTINPVGLDPLVFVSSHEDMRAVLRAPADVLHPGKGAAAIAPLVGEGSFMLSEGDDHLAGRKAILSAFPRQRIADHAEAIREITDREISTWPVNTEIASHPYLRALSLRVILSTLFETRTPHLERLHEHLLRMLDVTRSLALQEHQLRRLPPWRVIWSNFLTEREVVAEILDDLIAAGTHSQACPYVGARPNDEVSRAPRRRREDLMSLILAGHETTASQLAWAFQLIAHNPKVASRLLNTIREGDDSYLIATIREVLRHRPVFLFAIPRAVAKPYTLSGHVYHPPAQLVPCIHLLHHDPATFDDPESFRPERFLEFDDHAHLMPWGGGRKRCPGQHLATLEMQIVLREALSRFEILPASSRIETARWRSVIVTPGLGSRVVLRPRSSARMPPRARHSPFF